MRSGPSSAIASATGPIISILGRALHPILGITVTGTRLHRMLTTRRTVDAPRCGLPLTRNRAARTLPRRTGGADTLGIHRTKLRCGNRLMERA